MAKTDKKMDTCFYIAGWCLVVLIAVYYILSTRIGKGFLHFSYPCMLHKITGYYCPGCGGTRAVFYLMQGKFAASFRAHPIVLFAAVFGGWFMISQSVQRISRDKIKIGMHFRPIYLWLALAVLLINFIVKNAALYFFQVDLLGNM